MTFAWYNEASKIKSLDMKKMYYRANQSNFIQTKDRIDDFVNIFYKYKHILLS